jgi:site-specific recombinase XerC
MYQILKFLKHHGTDWVNNIKLPPDPDYTPKRISNIDIKNTLEYLRKDIHYSRYKAIILLGYTSGLRAEEL